MKHEAELWQNPYQLLSSMSSFPLPQHPAPGPKHVVFSRSSAPRTGSRAQSSIHVVVSPWVTPETLETRLVVYGVSPKDFESTQKALQLDHFTEPLQASSGMPHAPREIPADRDTTSFQELSSFQQLLSCPTEPKTPMGLGLPAAPWIPNHPKVGKCMALSH